MQNLALKGVNFWMDRNKPFEGENTVRLTKTEFLR